MMTRRQFLIAGAAAALWPAGCILPVRKPEEIFVNDIHSGLNRTRVARQVPVASLEMLQSIIRTAKQEGKSVSIAGGRHAMGGQQFGTDTVLLDMTSMNRILRFDPEKGEVEAEAGVMWPALTDFLLEVQAGREEQWGIVQKQTGADRLTLGGALAANIHGRGLR
jgi:FAD/FMN-containing dehydrogenase